MSCVVCVYVCTRVCDWVVVVVGGSKPRWLHTTGIKMQKEQVIDSEETGYTRQEMGTEWASANTRLKRALKV